MELLEEDHSEGSSLHKGDPKREPEGASFSELIEEDPKERFWRHSSMKDEPHEKNVWQAGDLPVHVLPCETSSCVGFDFKDEGCYS